MKTFLAYLTERAASAAIVTVVKHGTHKSLSASRFDIQFILPDGQPVELSHDLVHARAVHEAGEKAGLDIRLIDVLEAGIVRSASASAYQVGAAITSAQAQFMFDRVQAQRFSTVSVSVADADYARRHADENSGVGPIEINDKDWSNFELDRAKPASIRNWVNGHY